MNAFSAPPATVRQPETPAEAQVPFGILIARVSAELGHLTGLSLQLQTVLSGVVPDAQMEPCHLAGLQTIDLITQSLADLARLTGNMAENMSRDCAISSASIRRSVMLFDLSQRLALGAPQDAIRRATFANHSGDIDWL